MGRPKGIPALAAHEVKADDLREFVAAAATGDPTATAALIGQLGASVLGAVRKVLGRNHPDVDDVAQDAVMAFLDALGKFRGECSVKHFAQRVALLTALAARRRMTLHQRSSESEDPLGNRSSASDPPSPLALTLASRRREMVLRLLDELPEVTAEALALHFVLGYSVEEIAAAAGVSPNTVWSRLRLGKKALRHRLAGDARLLDQLAEHDRPAVQARLKANAKVKG